METKKIIKAACITAAVFFTLSFMHVCAAGETAQAEYTDEVSQTEEETEEQEQQAGDYPALPFDLWDIMKENEDVTGAIFIPALQTAYPVVWKEYENDWYMEHDIEGNRSSRGCIMIDGWNTPDLTDCMTLVHGHNMADGSMFGALKRFLDDETLAQLQPYIYYYLPGRNGKIRTYRYQVCSYYVTDIYDKTYYQPEIYLLYHGDAWNDLSKETREVLDTFRDDWYDGFAYDMRIRAVHALPIPDLSERPHLLILSTCHGEVHGDTRLVVACARV